MLPDWCLTVNSVQKRAEGGGGGNWNLDALKVSWLFHQRDSSFFWRKHVCLSTRCALICSSFQTLKWNLCTSTQKKCPFSCNIFLWDNYKPLHKFPFLKSCTWLPVQLPHLCVMGKAILRTSVVGRGPSSLIQGFSQHGEAWDGLSSQPEPQSGFGPGLGRRGGRPRIRQTYPAPLSGALKSRASLEQIVKGLPLLCPALWQAPLWMPSWGGEKIIQGPLLVTLISKSSICFPYLLFFWAAGWSDQSAVL